MYFIYSLSIVYVIGILTNQMSCLIFYQTSQSHGHRRTSSWGRTYSFSSAINRGFLTEEQNRDVKAGIQSTLQVCVYDLSWDHSILCFDSAVLMVWPLSIITVFLFRLFVLLFFSSWLHFRVCRCSWLTPPMCSCWSRARMYLNS